jgi:predicted regulator of Ras-like GTPase activity (Roadblock/LC7/MglB family)
MKIPFLNLFKKGGAGTKQSEPESSKPSPVSKPEGERLSKTVMPNATRVVSAQDTSETVSSALGESAFESPAGSPRAISFGPKRKSVVGRNKDLPPAVALALEPKVERTISLELADVIRQLPPGLTKPIESLDGSRRILFKASELERKMSAGKPTVSLGSIYHQAPEIFLRTVAPSDTTQIELPFDKVLEAFMQMHVRRDQVRDEGVPQVETPFLQATLEDNERFGVPNEPTETSASPPVRVEPATARTISPAEPEPVVSEQFVPMLATAETIAAAHPEAATTSEKVGRASPLQLEKPVRIPLAKQAEGKTHVASKTAPERIPFHLPPKGTGVPASERVPASCGPPVSTSLPPPPAPARIPFDVTAPHIEMPKQSAVETPPPVTEATVGEDKKISLALKAVLESLPVFELSGDPKEVAEDARVEFSFSLIQSQLASGRVAVPPELFEKALPTDCRRFFTAKNLQMPVLLPLQEVLRNLPADALRMRGDQEERETIETIETPFSTTAAEDAKRFGKSRESIPAEPAPIPPATEPAASAAGEPALDAKSVIAQANQLPGVRACALTFADGLSLAGNLPAEIGAEALCAVAPALLERIQSHVADTAIGELNAVTLHCAKSAVTFLKHANICLAVLHTNGELTVDVRAELGRMLAELSRTYSQPEASHVDH